ncbi:MAG: dihydrofolate reductase [bacterium]|nr:dihydrofolate reductase [bacterium]
MDTGVNVKISIIVAMAKNWVIGRGGDLPWHLNADLKRFKNLTAGHAVIVGRKTHESIIKRLGHPLVDRKTIIITRQLNYSVPSECKVAPSWNNAIKLVCDEQEIFVIGGAEIYRLAIPYAKRIYLTKVHAKCTGDTFFPVYNTTEWQEIFSEVRRTRDKDNDYDFTFVILERKKLGLLL